MNHILGQPAATKTLADALGSGRVHHAWIFHGPQGVGKFTTAVAFAKTLLCPNAQPDLTGQVAACDACASCNLVDRPEAEHPDLHVITKELARYSNDAAIRSRKLLTIPLDVLRSRLLGPAYLKPARNHGKVFIVDEAELLHLDGQNTLLKALEEPPDGTYLILVTSQEERLLPTIRSRSQRVAFGLMDDQVVADWLAQQEDADAKRAATIVAFSRGSIGRAVLALEFGLDGWLKVIEPMVDRVASGKGEPDWGSTVAKLTDDYASQWVDSRKNASKDAANKAAIRTMISVLGDLCRRNLESAAAQCPPGELEQGEAALEPWLAGVDLLHEAEEQLAGNVAPALLLENLAIQWTARAN